MVWKPNVTVAAVAERDGRFLLIEEETTRGRLFNQPAGHLESGESLLEAVVREALEESAYSFAPTALVGIYQYRSGAEGVTYLRFAFAGEITGHDPRRALDTGIVRAVWLAPDEIRRDSARHRSPLVMRCIDDYVAGQRYPLSVVYHQPA
ncbi:MAG TPA: NUDIX hydrolase [Burkholderiales bacterium]|jgi:8-oxo-dGTP pyrophosphatase MutT (NUDIX family)|nr:NUDIX hydrolase [Burkholderiales bacterium]